MSINGASIGTSDINENPRMVIRMIDRNNDGSMPDPLAPGELVGMYNPAVGMVELYLADAIGSRFLKVFG